MSELPKKPRRRRLFIALVVGMALVVGSLAYFIYYQNVNCGGLVGCGPYPKLSMNGGRAQVGSFGPALCQMTQFTAVCPINVVAGDSGQVTVTVTFQGVKPGTYMGGVGVSFLVYSSAARYVNFTSIPECAFSSAPSLNTRGCIVPPNGSLKFMFNFTVLQTYTQSNQHWPDSITVDMWQSCCFP